MIRSGRAKAVAVLRSWTPRVAFIFCDAVLAALSLPLAVELRVGHPLAPQIAEAVRTATPLFVPIALAAFAMTGLYQNVWRYASVQELLAILKAASVAVLALLIALFLITRLEGLPRSTPIIQWLVLIALLGGVRLGPRLIAEGGFRLRRPPPASMVNGALLVGTGDGTSIFLQALRRAPEPPCTPVGILDPSGAHVGLRLRGVPVIGTTRDLRRVVEQFAARGNSPRHLVFTAAAWELGRSAMQELINEGEALGLEVSRLPSLTELRRTNGNYVELRPIELTDLLGRPQAVLDRGAIDRLIEGRRVLITGAGGTIGGELTRQIAALRPLQIILLDASEFNLYEIDLTIRENHPGLARVPLLCNIRERGRVMQIFDRYRPELVFHAAALKHVPMVELNPCEGVLTNVVGTQNVADAACCFCVRAMAQVSSDKAVNPTSIMGATKRLAELYCQALDLQGRESHDAPRFMTVRFGNVLGSSGSLIPLFERQLARGGPLTITHPEIKRYFMTVREAVELVLQATARGLDKSEGLGEIFVLDMGQPIRIIDIARRMIRLAGLQPDCDIKLEITGLRPGEKLFEELFDAGEMRLPAPISGVLRAVPHAVPLAELRDLFRALTDVAQANDLTDLRALIRSGLPGYEPWEVASPSIETAPRPSGFRPVEAVGLQA